MNISKINSSFAKVLRGCLFYLQRITKDSSLLFSTFSNNSQYEPSYSYMGYIDGSTRTPFLMQFCNFLYNNGPAGVLIASSELYTTISNCSFQGNIHGCRFFRRFGYMSVEYCYLADKNTYDYANFKPYIQNTLTTFYTALLSHFSSEACIPKFSIDSTNYADFYDNLLICLPFYDVFYSALF